MGLSIVFGLLITAYAMAVAKRIQALIGNFRVQAACLCLLTFMEAWKTGQVGLYIVSFLLLALKVILIPYFLDRIVKEIKVKENLGLIINPQLSLVAAFVFTYLSWVFVRTIFPGQDTLLMVSGTVSFSMLSIGLFIMVFRVKALTQIVGLLVMENGIFLLASSVSGGMTFLVEMAIFFDVFICVLILGVFVYRINKLFVSLDVSKLNKLKG